MQEKHCNFCDKTKPISDFRKDMSSKDHHSYICGECDRARDRERWNRSERRRNLVRISERKRAAENPELFRIKKRMMRIANPEKAKALSRKYREKNDKKLAPQIAAKNAVQKAIRSGILVRPSQCSLCKKEPPKSSRGWSVIQGHHYKGYDHPLDIQWLCPPCHKDVEGYVKHRLTIAELSALRGKGNA
jgi:hypothetical protein